MSIEALLERLDALPTPSPLALRLAQAAADDAGSARELVELIRQDSALTARILSLCRRGPRGRAFDVASLDRAVVLLGFGAVRAAALAVEFVGGLAPRSGDGFDSERFRRHALAKALTADSLGRRIPGCSGGRGFVAGLLHDLGALALHRAAPALFDAACVEAEHSGRPLETVVAERLGLGLAAAGARLAARWNLPEELRVAIAFRGEAASIAPESHRRLALLAELADRAVRGMHIGGDGFGPSSDPQLERLDAIAAALGVELGAVHEYADGLFEELAARGASIGLSSTDAARLAGVALERARIRLSRLQARIDRVPPAADDIEELDAAGDPVATLGAIVRSIARRSGRRERLLVVSPRREDDRADLREFDAAGLVLASRVAGKGDADGRRAAARWCELRAVGASPGRLELGLRGAVLATILRAEGEVLDGAALAAAPVALWSHALAASIDRERSRRAADSVAEAARLEALLRERDLSDRVRASALRIAGGLAHELNNPLCIVSGRSQLLATRAPGAAADCAEIVAAAERASSIVTELLRVLRAAPAAVRECDASEIVERAVAMIAEALRERVQYETAQLASLRCAADPAQIAEALAEALENALHADPKGVVRVEAHLDLRGGRLTLAVRDAGPGFSASALRHAFDPFFSDRPAGRGAGLGLTRARSLVEASGGTIEVRNVGGNAGGRGGEREAGVGGAIVTIVLPAGSPGRSDDRGEGRGAAQPRSEAA
jgi:signal transduction histidine kinase/HD-like signal output (HDOD) protein